MITIRPIDDALFAVFQTWCAGHHWTQAPRLLFPKRGYMAFDGETPVMAGWLYRDPDTAYSMLEYVVADPASTGAQRGAAFPVLAQHIFAEAKALGAIMMHMAIEQAKRNTFGKRLEAEGFLRTDDTMTMYVKAL